MDAKEIFTSTELKALEEMAEQDGVSLYVMIRSLIRKEAERRWLISYDAPARPPNLPVRDLAR